MEESLSFTSVRSVCECNTEKSVVTNWQWVLHEFGLGTLFLKSFVALKHASWSPYMFLIRPSHFSSNGPYPIHLTKHFSTLPHPNRSTTSRSSRNIPRNDFFPLITFLESIQFQPSIGELEGCAKLLSVLGAWCLNLVNTTAETTLLCVFMDKRHCNCISSRPANELFNHLHMDVL